ncbi:hypothetical protein CJ255_15345 [Candidatus Viridilinea mediisalina]|uniref:histidine kinase n=2 Tax=Candidatus Viridilinea mediisalina TaxID=2024553 RepID=A0A2A6RGJ3_9CHLR|nr:hypothetical protein CJ255_15345 [Candidatus Viridilinea mediisalina]
MRLGACDYVMKDSLERLPVAVRREVREAHVRNQRRRFDLALHSLITGTVALTGSAFFHALVQQIAQTLEVRYVLINAVVDGSLHTLAHWGTEPLPPRPISTLEDSPTALALRHSTFSCPQGLAERFPTNAYINAWGAESYIGLALYASNQCAFGTLCILDTAPLHAPELIIDLLRLFATRAAAELERHQALQALEQWNRDLEQIVAERTEQLSAANQQLARVNLELVHAARMKDEFLANMSHELRTPLNAILAFSETLQEGVAGPVNAKQINALRHIETSGQHLLAMINDVLDLAKVEAGRVELQRELFAINDLCRGSLQLIKEQALKKRQQVDLKLNDEFAYIEADPRRLKQILVNLLSNAVKFTPNHGQISLEVEVLPEAQFVQFHYYTHGHPNARS